MSYLVIGDSCCDFNLKEKQDIHFLNVPLTMTVGGVEVRDDESFDQKRFLNMIAESEECPRSACPAPQAYLDEYKKADDSGVEAVFVVTLSSRLSGSYNSAMLAQKMFCEERPNSSMQIVVVDSKSAACGESLIALKAQELCESGMSFSEISEKVFRFRDEMKTFFVLENIETLRKNGRMSRIQALLANALSIKPVLGSNDGEITKVAQAMGIQKALNKMIQEVVTNVKNPENKILGITYCNCLERAQQVKEAILKHAKFKDVYIVNAGGISTMYANQGGIIITA